MEESKKTPIDEDYIMSIVSDTHSGQKKVPPAGHEQIRKTSVTEAPETEPEESVANLNKTGAEELPIEEKQEIREYKKRKNRQKPVDYESQFIKKTDLTVRSGKGVYIRSDYHNSINRIISVIGNNEISITDYLDNILTYHFEYFEQEITELFDKKYKPIIRTR